MRKHTTSPTAENNNPNNAAEQRTSDAEMFGQTFDEPSTEKPQRSARGRFAKGNRGGPGNPFAKQLGWMRSAFFTEATPERLRYIARTFLRMAAEGDVAAGRLVFTYAMGKSPPSPDTQDFTAEDFLPVEEFVPPEDVGPAEAPITQNVTPPAATVTPEGSCAGPSGWSQVEKEVLADLESFGLEEINEYICNNGEELRKEPSQAHRQQSANGCAPAEEKQAALMPAEGVLRVDRPQHTLSKERRGVRKTPNRNGQGTVQRAAKRGARICGARF